MQVLNKILLSESTQHVHEVAKVLYRELHRMIAYSENDFFDVKCVMEYLNKVSMVQDVVEKDETNRIVEFLKQKCKEKRTSSFLIDELAST